MEATITPMIKAMAPFVNSSTCDEIVVVKCDEVVVVFVDRVVSKELSSVLHSN